MISHQRVVPEFEACGKKISEQVRLKINIRQIQQEVIHVFIRNTIPLHRRHFDELLVVVIELFLPNHLRLGCPTEHVYHAFRGYTHGGSLDEIELRSEIQNDYAAGVGFDGLVNERADFGEVFDLLEALVDLSGGEAEDGAVQVDVRVR